MLDLGRAQVPMGSGSLEHPRERKAVDVLATLRPTDSLGQGPAHGVAVVAHYRHSPVAVELHDAEADELVEVLAGRLVAQGEPGVRGQAAAHVARVGPLFVVVRHPGSHEPDGIAPGGHIARDGGKALVFQRLVQRFDTSGRARDSDGGVGGKRIDDTESTKPDALVAPPPSGKTGSLEIDVRQTPRMRCHDATLASGTKGLTPFDLIARELETSSELR